MLVHVLLAMVATPHSDYSCVETGEAKDCEHLVLILNTSRACGVAFPQLCTMFKKLKAKMHKGSGEPGVSDGAGHCFVSWGLRGP